MLALPRFAPHVCPVLTSSTLRDLPLPTDRPLSYDRAVGNGARSEAADARWCALVATGDRAAFTEMFRAYADRLAAFAFTIVGTREVAEELVQDLFFTIWQRRETWVVHGTLKTYLYSSMRNRALDHLRSRRRFRHMEARAVHDDMSPATGTPALPAQRALEHEELAAHLSRAVDELPEQQRAVVRLRWFDQLSHAEIARIMDISVRTSENHLARAVARLRQVLAVHRR